ncbi:hypothetical protein BDV96DRAFT_588061 [Lophiotrema nucula]|uniref:Uncharacterized protein n=1 Tax=Lophiotrema nucula TaxID=690887 RepID=A0A6A5YLJ3_9PLEO|nr:hypothetical protein BDV96DRAFT_588061 [Lophiotrema nucula]
MASSVTKKDLMGFTTELHSRLPPEIRNAIYDELLDDDTIKKIKYHIERYLTCFQIDINPLRPEMLRVPFLRPNLINATMKAEIITQAISRSTIKTSIAGPFDIVDFVSADPLGFGLTAAQLSIRALKVSGCMDQVVPEDMDLTTLSEDFSPLYNINWAPGATLQFDVEWEPLETTLKFFKGMRPSPTLTADAVYPLITAFRPIARRLRDRGVTVSLQLGIADMRDRNAGDHLHLSKAKWRSRLRKFAGVLYADPWDV